MIMIARSSFFSVILIKEDADADEDDFVNDTFEWRKKMKERTSFCSLLLYYIIQGINLFFYLIYVKFDLNRGNGNNTCVVS
jgi:hypothetical protein